MDFRKYHALGNVYLVVSPDEFPDEPAALIIKNICHKHYGVASDGVLIGPFPSNVADFGLRIFNPDASEAEKSGNGLRIFCRALWDQGLVADKPFTIETKGGVVKAQVSENGARVDVEMGKVSFLSQDIPVWGEPREVLLENLNVMSLNHIYSAVTIGNPHCVILTESPTETMAKEFGPLIETHPNFPNRTNVQFMQVLDRNHIVIEIWERGAGYTLASGSSSCAAAAVAYKLGLCDASIKVMMPGGQIDIEISEDFRVSMSGSVTSVCHGRIADECLSQLFH
ncbi:diaminopimelate epimerase [Marinomonas sp. CT5]|uniref:diaminopimelate epimerase n=1 Tax=Marinomonas sp. CT5 TaxID=2066133 RepID=UPI001BAEB49B|nr:diaminopimelate epimerase [Marinomonas sp. CT5]QUX94403.1 diaminopimelate epimerase [Marinomonas sp. CT5]